MDLNKFHILRLSLCLGVLAVIAGCPRVAYVDFYNNTNVVLKLNIDDTDSLVPPGEHSKIKFMANTFSIKSGLGVWIYGRNIPHSGMDGEFFDGTLKVQVEPDGKVYALRRVDRPPIKVSNYKQPAGYPLSPSARR
jgi:hypothetical protein